MTQPALPSPAQILSGPAQALSGIERSLPAGVPPISQTLQSIATSIPNPGATGGLPFPVPGVGGAFPLPLPGGVGGATPLGIVPNILATLAPGAPVAPVARGTPLRPAGGGVLTGYARTGIG